MGEKNRNLRTGDPPSAFWLLRVLPVLFILAFLSILTVVGDRPPAPMGINSPADGFSAKRAFQAYIQALGIGKAHPTGSLEQKLMGDRLFAQFKQMGYQPQIQEAWVCSRWTHGFAQVRNIMARLDGIRNDQAVLVTAHYDSVPCGPGVMDDGVGTAAVIEIARALREGRKLAYPVIFLLSDGEEIGLNGAKAFLERHPWARSVRTTIAIDAGGDGGPSLISQTAGDSRVIMNAIQEVAHPVGSSAIGSFLEAFHLVGGTSDFDEYQKAGRNGVNLINSGWYFNHHTPWDNPARMNLNTLQDHGNHALTLTRRLASQRGSTVRAASGVFFDLFGLVLIHYSRLWAWLIQIFSLLVGLAFLLIKPGRERIEWLWISLKGSGGWVLVLLSGTLGGTLTIFVANKFTWPPVIGSGDPPLILGLVLLATALVSFLVFRLFDSRLRNKNFLIGTWMAWNALGVVTCALLPGVSYLLSWPALAIGLALFLPQLEENSDFHQWIPCIAIAGLLWLPLFLRLAAFEPPNLLSVPLFMLIWSLIVPLLPMKSGHQTGSFVVLIILALLGPLMVLNGPPKERPRAYGNIIYLLDVGKEKAYWILSGQTASPIWRAAGTVKWVKLGNPILGLDRKLPLVKARSMRLAHPEAILESRQSLPDGRTRLRFRLHSIRRARVVWIAVSPRPLTLKADGLEMTPLIGEKNQRKSRANEKDPWQRWFFVGKPEGFELELIMAERRPIRLSVMDQTEGLPSFGEKLLKARPKDAVPYQNGDLTLVAKTFTFR